jgi:hypothetical protein
MFSLRSVAAANEIVPGLLAQIEAFLTVKRHRRRIQSP